MAAKKKNNQYQELLAAMDVLEKEKGIKKEVIVEALTDALANAYKKNYDDNNARVEAVIDDRTGAFKVYVFKKVVEEVVNPIEEISLRDAMAISHGYELGDDLRQEVTPGDFGRIAAQTAKNVVLQKLREFAHPGYYARMAAAWCGSTAYIHFPEKTEAFLREGTLDGFTHNKLIQKVCESRRVNDETRTRLRALRR